MSDIDHKFCITFREPVDRVMSSYEFAMEVAARAARKKPHKIDPSRASPLILSIILKKTARHIPGLHCLFMSSISSYGLASERRALLLFTIAQ